MEELGPELDPKVGKVGGHDVNPDSNPGDGIVLHVHCLLLAELERFILVVYSYFEAKLYSAPSTAV